MIETGASHTTQSLQALVGSLARVDRDVTDAERIDQLTALEQVKAAAAAAQAVVTAGFVSSQQDVAAGWREQAAACSAAGDFDGWRAARDNADRASWTVQNPTATPAQHQQGEQNGHGEHSKQGGPDGAGIGAGGQAAGEQDTRDRLGRSRRRRLARTGSRRRSRSPGGSPRPAAAST